jgi:hypothetical protein
LLIIRFTRERKLTWNVPLFLVFAISAVIIPARVDSLSITPVMKPLTAPLANDQRPTTDYTFSGWVRQIGRRRAGFKVYGPQGSTIDQDVRLNTVGDIARFMPRATLIGFMAPFPSMWFEAGKGGRAGRMVGGFETLLMYLAYALAGVCLWRGRRRIELWFVALVAIAGIVALGLILANVGALFRLRYVFWFMLIVLAVKGAMIVWNRNLSSSTALE